mmetsp:Transcript_145122/g.205403  ORF Transcript_145122/g.205403 Transcript_145122/m.205403 type:complete len:211 (-) Transcript_145122:383-1015(-)
MTAAGEADEVLQAAGFAVCGEDEGADDEDGSLCPPPRASVRGGGDLRLPERLGLRATPVRLWSFEKGSVSAGVGFVCARDLANSLLYATLMSEGEAPGISDATKSAIRTLLDLAEACSTRKIIMGLSPEHASCEGLACSLLRLGFQVISVRKCPVLNAALMLEFDMGPPAPLRGNHVISSDYTCSGTSDCSTSAEDHDHLQCDSECQDSD